jgi:hypothetical protein
MPSGADPERVEVSFDLSGGHIRERAGMLVSKVADVCRDRPCIDPPLGKMTHVITCGFGGRGTFGSLALPSKELGEQSGVKVADLAATIPQEEKLFLGSPLCLGQIVGRAQDALASPAAVPFPPSI